MFRAEGMTESKALAVLRKNPSFLGSSTLWVPPGLGFDQLSNGASWQDLDMFPWKSGAHLKGK